MTQATQPRLFNISEPFSCFGYFNIPGLPCCVLHPFFWLRCCAQHLGQTGVHSRFPTDFHAVVAAAASAAACRRRCCCFHHLMIPRRALAACALSADALRRHNSVSEGILLSYFENATETPRQILFALFSRPIFSWIMP